MRIIFGCIPLTLQFLHRKQVMCPHCRGLGAESPDDVKKCPVCRGSGVEVREQKLGPGFVQRVQQQFVLVVQLVFSSYFPGAISAEVLDTS